MGAQEPDAVVDGALGVVALVAGKAVEQRQACTGGRWPPRYLPLGVPKAEADVVGLLPLQAVMQRLE